MKNSELIPNIVLAVINNPIKTHYEISMLRYLFDRERIEKTLEEQEEKEGEK
ncbi:MAG: hypothetical protein LBL82_00275 [Oscillospiraceae bacterium]|jgi:hypothetical protein|nr:hypothetical protein [Oscillospiraceae bacterium]